jgi:hypothetical protein
MIEVVSQSQGGKIALLMQESLRAMISEHQNSIVQPLMLEICKMDRTAILGAMQQVMQHELTTASLNKTGLDEKTYLKAITDLTAVLRQAPLPPLHLKISLPEFDLGSNLDASQSDQVKPDETPPELHLVDD